MSAPAISVRNVGKKYLLSHQPREQYTALRDVLSDGVAAFARRLRHPFAPGERADSVEEFWALQDVSFEIKQGERVGIIGRNGAGKSTLLKILSRITEPSTGSIRIRGKVASLLEVGTGFHPELTGRENIYLNGAILGMRREEIRRKFDEIVQFAEIEKFLDTPVKRYSSGMYVRLAFAVAAHLEPEILVVDEVLAVGDAQFQNKCLGKMEAVGREGRTVLFVSHNMGAINKLCDRAIWLESGQLLESSDTETVVQKYLSSAFLGQSTRQFPVKSDKAAQVLQVRLLNGEHQESTEFGLGEEPFVEVRYLLNHELTGIHVACIVTTVQGVHAFSTADTDTNPKFFEARPAGEYVSWVRLPMKDFNSGIYHVAIGIGIPGVQILDRQEALSFTLHDTGGFATLKEGARRAGLLVFEVPWHLREKP
ncbi:ABC transporter ATP-binding protein [Geomonas azotofigens]|uniref:ABC transporter ATP-binding protein n=1 Tax=Geomonas azotofigens TaxID=2843196 RepID=UPI001C0FD57C|nr:ABC transporter ATP-binding protein [Geomonas azotofigens]MBU5612558.1 ABC transporter ATP-binding protein [Geomonas azotofigens]